MSDEFLREYVLKAEKSFSKKRVKKNIAAVKLLIEKEDNSMTRRKFRFKRLIIAVAVTIISMVSLFTVVYAATQGAVIKFFMGGEEIEGEYYDYVDDKGFQHVSFGAVLPIYEENFAIIYDVDAPQGENVRVITDETDAVFMENLCLYKKALDEVREAANKAVEETGIADQSGKFTTPDPEDFGLVFKDSELCVFRLGFVTKSDFNLCDGTLGGKFMYTGAAAEMPSGSGGKDAPNVCDYDWESETKTYKHTFYYYVGKD